VCENRAIREAECANGTLNCTAQQKPVKPQRPKETATKKFEAEVAKKSGKHRLLESATVDLEEGESIAHEAYTANFIKTLIDKSTARI
jgi:hypothetical protein